MNKIINKLGKKINGEIKIPGDKSISIRVALLSNIFHGDFCIDNFNYCDDTMATLDCLNALKAIKNDDSKQTIILNCKNSATTMRLLAGILCGLYTGTNKKFKLIGDTSLSKRPMDRIVIPLCKMGANIKCSINGTAPLYINYNNKFYHNNQNPNTNKLTNLDFKSKISSAQLKSCLELAAFCGKVKLKYKEPIKSRNHTELMLRHFKNTESHEYFVPSDISTASHFIVNALLYNDSSIIMKHIGINNTRIGFLKVLSKMGIIYKLSNIKTLQGEKIADIKIKNCAIKKPITINKKSIPSMIDEIMLISLLSAFAPGKSKISGLNELKYKESNRFIAICQLLNYLNVKYIARNDSITIVGNPMLLNKKTGYIPVPYDRLSANQKKALKFLKNSKDHRVLLICKILNIKDLKYKSYLNTSI